MKKIKLSPEEFSWQNRFAKRHADELAFRIMVTWARRNKDKRVLSLPAAEWLWERAFSSIFPEGEVTFFGIEKDFAVYQRMRDIDDKQLYPMHKLMPLCNMSFEEFALAPVADPFNMIYLDWCGSWGKDKLAQITAMFDNNLLAPDSLFRFTIALTRDHPRCWEELNDVESSSFTISDIRGGGGEIAKWKTTGIPALVETVGQDFGRKVRPLALQVYPSYSKTKSRPMGSFLFHVK